MKKLSKVFLSLALVLVMAIPMIAMTGCDLFNSNKGNEIVSIALTKQIKTEYNVGDAIDFNDAKLLIRYNDETENQITLASDLVTNFSTQTTGNRTMKISYKGKEISVNYSVTAPVSAILTSGKWCLKSIVAGELSQALSTNEFTYMSMYMTFDANGNAKSYAYDVDESRFKLIELGTITYTFNSTTREYAHTESATLPGGEPYTRNYTGELNANNELIIYLGDPNNPSYHYLYVKDYYEGV